MPLPSFELGQLMHLTSTFKVSGVLTDPTTVTYTLRDPTGAITNPAAVHDSTGQYHYDQLATLAGTWWFTSVSTGTCATGGQLQIDVAGGHTT
jgi:hypothetical protein